MTTIITRYFEDAAQARTVERELFFRKFSRRAVRVFDESEGLIAELTDLGVDPATAEAYEHRVGKSGAVMLVLADYRPLGAARIARDLMAENGATSLGNLPEEIVQKQAPLGRPSVLTEHPHILLSERDPDDTNYYMADWPIPLISRRKPYSDMLIDPHARMANWPFPLIARIKPRDEFAFPRHARMANIIFPLTIRRAPSDNFIFPRHARMADWPIRLISRRKPYTGTMIGRHTRMANWPFPHLINGKQGTNALIPGGPRMANFPMRLISRHKPIDAFAFPRHARMADLFLPLVSRRKPITASIIPKHARMADFILPLIAKRKDTPPGEQSSFSLSRLLGLPTTTRR
jgi:hypothetical protein